MRKLSSGHIKLQDFEVFVHDVIMKGCHDSKDGDVQGNNEDGTSPEGAVEISGAAAMYALDGEGDEEAFTTPGTGKKRRTSDAVAA
eukprot:2150466-Amphidinium_carterae.1